MADADTKDKRFSFINLAMPGPGILLFDKDGTVDAGDKYHMLHLYSGITLSSPVEVSFVSGVQEEFTIPAVAEKVFTIRPGGNNFVVSDGGSTFLTNSEI